jgi:tRNA G10  N-methylase Trm11
MVIDPFVGGGTTLIEAWLTGRRSFGIDISPIAVKTAQERIKEMEDESKNTEERQLSTDFRPVVIEGDARNMKELLSRYDVSDESVKLACIHPPYLDSLTYTATIEGDLSRISDEDAFCDQLGIIARQTLDLIHSKGICAVLIGDVKRDRKVVRLGFLVMERFEQEGFQLTDIIIKTQHKDTSTKFWYTKQKKLDYLMAHEYLFIFSKK